MDYAGLRILQLLQEQPQTLTTVSSDFTDMGNGYRAASFSLLMLLVLFPVKNRTVVSKHGLKPEDAGLLYMEPAVGKPHQ